MFQFFYKFCGIYFKHKKLILPIVMFTDPAKWRKPVKDKFSLSLGQYPVNEFTYRLIKLKAFKAEEFEKKINENPLAAAYLPLTDFPKEKRPIIKAKAIKGISKIAEGRKRATLYSLIQEIIVLDSEEEKQFREIIHINPIYQEVKMLQSIEEVGMEQGMEQGRIQAMKEVAIKMLSSDVLAAEQISLLTGLEISIIKELAKDIQFGKQSH
ncbi:MAG: hypothetical protein U9N77_09210 [Thermodesulfobacteriota bacterium]|nr:hypothetical protein [Thermodesulfobacteriota bacterium]